MPSSYLIRVQQNIKNDPEKYGSEKLKCLEESANSKVPYIVN